MTIMRWREAASIAGIAVSVACTLEQDSNPFGSGGGGYPMSSTAAPVESDTGDDEESSGDDDDDDEGEADDGTPAGDESSSDGGGDPSTTMTPMTDPTMDPTGDPTGVSTDDGGDPTGAMPGTGGLYDHCLQPEDCGPGTTACLQIVDEMNMPVAGFCTHEGCSNPAVDCGLPTTGNALPFCLPVMIGNMQDAVCALDCTGGEQCPAGTMCIPLETVWVCA